MYMQLLVDGIGQKVYPQEPTPDNSIMIMCFPHGGSPIKTDIFLGQDLGSTFH